MEKRKINKKAQGHVEMMLSFALFIGALVFIFLFINPFTKTQDKTTQFDNTEQAIIRNLTYEVGKLSAVSYILPVYNPTGCYNANFLDYSNKPYIETLAGSAADKKLYIIYFYDKILSSEAGNNSVSCPLGNYSIGSYSKENLISYEKMREIAGLNPGDYSAYKRSIGITNDFYFSSKYMNSTYIPELSFPKRVPGSVESGAREYPVRVIDTEGKIYEVILNIRIW